MLKEFFRIFVLVWKFIKFKDLRFEWNFKKFFRLVRGRLN